MFVVYLLSGGGSLLPGVLATVVKKELKKLAILRLS